jgi:hypothetical protein
MWQQKLVIMVATVTVGGGATTMAMTIYYTSPCQINICYFAAFHTMHLLRIKASK